MQICVLVGNPKAGSRTLSAAEQVARRLAGPADTLTTIDLAEHADQLFAWPSEQVDALSATASGCDVLVVASPTYKATYTGLLKAFLDRYQAGDLRGVRAVPVMTGADKGHQMAPDTGLRPLLVELGASVPTSSIYIETPKLDALDAQLDAWLAHNGLEPGAALRPEKAVVR